jgi:membrane fusion protein, adhesin transport system
MNDQIVENPEVESQKIGSELPKNAVEYISGANSVDTKSKSFFLLPHFIYIFCAITTVAFMVWASVTTLDIVSIATGEVVPSSQLKTVQHLEGGIVSKILVREGEIVEKGQKLVVLAPTASSADVNELKVRLAGLEIEVVRLDGLVSTKNKPSYSAQLQLRYPKLVEQSIQRAKIQRRRHNSELLKQKKSILQRRQTVAEVKIRIKNSKAGLKLIREQVAISKKLLSQGLTNRYDHLDLLKEEGRLNGGIEEDLATVARAKAALAEGQASLAAIQDIFDDENRKELDKARQTYSELSQRMAKYKDSYDRTSLRAPVGGIVKSLYVATIGGVIKAGDPVIDLVPEGDRLVIEAKLATADIGYVERGQDVIVKLASADAARFDGLAGEVASISPDTLMTPEGSPYYKVMVQTNKSYFEKGKARYNLLPGMQVVANIQTGQRKVFEYFLEPFLASMGDAMQER